jgi:2-succinyl-6-hydroxy-2,4-cyclohexadiene-1-carboxylate synthase
MKVNIGSVRYHVEKHGSHTDTKPIVLLHGFSGSGESFEHLFEKLSKITTIYAVDLIGHGKTESPDEKKLYRIENQLEQIDSLIIQLGLKTPILWGYSMGGRLALNYVIKFPFNISGLILESTNNGIENEADRDERARKDAVLSSEILNDYTSFLEKWNRLPLFKSPNGTTKIHFDKFAQVQKSQNPLGLAQSISEFSPANIPYISDELKHISQPVLILTGENDIGYTKLWIDLTKLIKNANHIIIQKAGHRVHLDNPDDYIIALEKYLTETNLITL